MDLVPNWQQQVLLSFVGNGGRGDRDLEPSDKGVIEFTVLWYIDFWGSRFLKKLISWFCFFWLGNNCICLKLWNTLQKKIGYEPKLAVLGWLHGQGKMVAGQGKVREKSGNFIFPKRWQPWLNRYTIYRDTCENQWSWWYSIYSLLYTQLVCLLFCGY